MYRILALGDYVVARTENPARDEKCIGEHNAIIEDTKDGWGGRGEDTAAESATNVFSDASVAELRGASRARVPFALIIRRICSERP